MNAILAITIKDIRQLLGDRVGAFFVFLFPALFGILFGLIFGGTGGGGPSAVDLAFVDHDGSPASRRFVRFFDDTDAFAATVLDDEASAEAAVRGGDFAAVIILPAGLDDALGSPLRLFADGETPGIEIGVDPGSRFLADAIRGQATAAVFRLLSERFADPVVARETIRTTRSTLDRLGDADPEADARADAEGMDAVDRLLLDTALGAFDRFLGNIDDEPAAEPATPPDADDEQPAGDAFTPIAVEFRDLLRDREGPPNAFAITFPQACAWGILGCVTGFGISLVQERTRGTLDRIIAGPLAPRHVIAAKALGCFVVSLAVQVLIVALGYVFFAVRPDSWGLLAAGIVAACFGFTGFMMVLAAAARTEAAAEGISRAVLLSLALLGGAGVPLFFMPEWMQPFAAVSPFRWVIIALEGAIWRGFTWSQMVGPIAVLLGLGAVCLAAGSALYTRRLSR